MTGRHLFKAGLALLAALVLLCCGVALADGLAIPDGASVTYDEFIIVGSSDRVIIPEVPGAIKYQLCVKDTANDWHKVYQDDNITEAGDYWIPDETDEGVVVFDHEGFYSIELSAYSSATKGNFLWYGTIAVFGEEPADGEVKFIYTPAEDWSVGRSTFCAAVWAPGAEAVSISIPNNTQLASGERINRFFEFLSPGDTEVTATAMYADGHTETESTGTHSVASNGSLNVPAIDLPDSVIAGEDLSFLLKRAGKNAYVKNKAGENANIWYNVDVWDITDDCQAFSAEYKRISDDGVPTPTYLGTGKTVTIPASALQAGHLYDVVVNVTANGWDPYTYHKIIPVVSGADDRLTVSVEGYEGNTVEVPTNTDYSVRVDVPEDATAMRLYTEEGFHYYAINSEDPLVIEIHSQWDVLQITYFAQAYYGEIGDTPLEELDWGDSYSNSVRVYTQGSGYPVAAEVSTPDGNVIERGNYMRLHLESGDENACSIATLVFDQDWNQYDDHWFDENGDVLIPTAQLRPGDYHVIVATSVPGMRNRDVSVPFKVVDNNHQIVWLSAERNELTSFENYRVTFSADDATYLKFFDGVEWRDDEWREPYVTMEVDHAPGEYDIQAKAVYENEDGSTWEELSNTVHITVTSQGPAPIEVYVPGIINPGEDLTIQATGLSEYVGDEWWDVWVDEQDGQGRVWTENHDTAEIKDTFIVPANVLQSDHTYRVHVYGHPFGYDALDTERIVFVSSGGIDENIHLSIDGSEEMAYRDARDRATIHVQLDDDYTGLIRYWNGNWEFLWDFEPHSTEFDFEVDVEAGVNGVLVAGTKDEYDRDDFNWEELNYGGSSQMMNIYGNYDGETDPITQVNIPETIPVGSLLPIEIFGAENAFQFHVFISDQDWNDIADRWYDGYDTTASTPFMCFLETGALVPGESYQVRVDATGHGKTWTNADGYWFTATDPELTSDSGVTLDLNRNYVYTWDEIVAGVTAPEGGWIELHCGYEDWRGMGDAPAARMELNYESSGEYDVYAVAHYEDQDLESNHWTVTVEAPNGGFDITIDAPGLLPAGEDLMFTVDNLSPDSENYWWDVDVHSIDEGFDWSRHFNVDDTEDGRDIETRTFTIPGDELPADHRYGITVDVGGPGHEQAHAEADLFVYGEQDAQAVRLTIDEEDSSLDAQVGQQVTLRAYAPGATAIAEYQGDFWWVVGTPDEEGYMEWTEWLDSENTVYMVRASYDENINPDNIITWVEGYREYEWGPVSNIVNVNVQDNGPLNVGDIGWEVPETVVRGEMLPVSLWNLGDATRVHASLSIEGDEEGWDWDGIQADENGRFTFYMNTARLRPGSYRLQVSLSGLGRNWAERFEADGGLPVEITDPGEEVVLGIPVTEVREGDEFLYNVFAAGAGHIEVIFANNQDENHVETFGYDGEWVHDGHRLNGPTTYDVYAVAYWYDDEGNEIGQRESRHITMNVFTEGRADAPVIHAPTTMEAGEDLVFTIEGLDYGDNNWFDISVNKLDYQNPDAGGWTDIIRFTRDDSDPNGEFHVPAADLPGGYLYEINAWVDPTGMDGNNSKHSIYVYEQGARHIDLWVDEDDNCIEIGANEEFTVHINAPGANAIRLYVNGGISWLDGTGGDGTFEWTCGWLQDEGENQVYATACYGDPVYDGQTLNCFNDLYAYDWGWETQNWEGISDVATVNVWVEGQSGSGYADVSDFVHRGELLRADNFHAEDTEWVEVRVVAANNFWGQDYYYHRYDYVPSRIMVPTGDLQPGDYILRFDTIKPGYIANQNHDHPYFFTVSDPNAQVVLDIEKNYAETGEGIFYTAWCEGADHMRVYMLNENGDENGIWEHGGSLAFANDLNSWWPGDKDVYAEARDADDNVIATSDHMTLHVTSSGDLTAPEQHFPQVLRYGDDMVFSFGSSGNVDWYKVMVSDTRDWHWVANYDFEEPGEYTLDNFIEGQQLEPGVVYEADISVWTPGYTPAGGDNYVAVVEPEKTLFLPAVLTTIEEEAFANVDAQIIVVPDTVTEIQYRAFADCQHLALLVIPDGVQWDDGIFEGCACRPVVVSEYPF